MFLIFFIGIFSGENLRAQDERYRVEILVLTHLNHGEEPEDLPALNDYSDALDFLTPEPEEDDAGDDVAIVTVDTETAEAVSGEDQTDAPLAETDPEAAAEEAANAVFPVPEMSDVMSEAWRRLRLSAPFRPEQYLSWEQGSQPPFPALRVHDLEVVWADDPWADFREALADIPATDVGSMGIPLASLNDPDGEDSAASLLPDPTRHYRLDGTATLRRTRFLHLDLDLQLREAVFDELPATLTPEPLTPAPMSATVESSPRRNPSAYLSFGLKQSRQVKTGRMEYFDSPVLGVLAYISQVETETEDGGEPEAP